MLTNFQYVQNNFEEFVLCSICFEPFVYPISLICGHTFCKLCLIQQIKNGLKKCAICNQLIDLKILNNSQCSIVIKKLTDSLLISCSSNNNNGERECQWTGERGNLEEHRKSNDCKNSSKHKIYTIVFEGQEMNLKDYLDLGSHFVNRERIIQGNQNIPNNYQVIRQNNHNVDDGNRLPVNNFNIYRNSSNIHNQRQRNNQHHNYHQQQLINNQQNRVNNQNHRVNNHNQLNYHQQLLINQQNHLNNQNFQLVNNINQQHLNNHQLNHHNHNLVHNNNIPDLNNFQNQIQHHIQQNQDFQNNLNHQFFQNYNQQFQQQMNNNFNNNFQHNHSFPSSFSFSSHQQINHNNSNGNSEYQYFSSTNQPQSSLLLQQGNQSIVIQNGKVLMYQNGNFYQF